MYRPAPCNKYLFAGWDAYTTTAYPGGITGCQIEEYLYYDNYAFPGDALMAARTFDAGFAGHYLPGNQYTTPQPYTFLAGVLTGRKTRILPNFKPGEMSIPSDWVREVLFYDRQGRVTQSQRYLGIDNSTSAPWDVHTVQYTFTGQQALDIDQGYAWPGVNKLSTLVLTKYYYNPTTGLLASVNQKTDQSTNWRTIASYRYNELGQVEHKSLGGVEDQDMTYNIRGQLTGMNAGYIDDAGSGGPATFGYALSYDYGYEQLRYDGKIAGFTWRGAGKKSTKATYGYRYDAAGRMTHGDYYNFSSVGLAPATWNKTNKDYTAWGIAYDNNGNLTQLRQKGVRNSGGVGDIDFLTYSYVPNSDQLNYVQDAIGDGLGTLYHPHNFKNGPSGVSTTTDYGYDADGNLKADANKGITSITYNYLDLPLTVTGAGGTVYNTYTAAGELLQKTVAPAGGAPTYTQRYLGRFAYRGDKLESFSHAEGRCRWLADSSFFKYDYFVKDHLGNVRTVVAADAVDMHEYLNTNEVASANLENLLFENVEPVRAPRPGPPGVNNSKAARLNGASDSTAIGPALLLEVMAGDQFHVQALGWYYGEQEVTGHGVHTTAGDMLAALLGTLAGGAGSYSGEGGDGELLGNLLNESSYVDLYNPIKEQGADPTQPRAYLNWLVFDEGMRLVADQSGARQVSAAAADNWETLALPNALEVGQNGYLLVYLSDESHKDVFFDNLRIQHFRGRLLEEQHYYPHGVVIEQSNGLSLLKNKQLYQGKTLQDELGMELYDFHARQYDAQVGRFWGIDPLDQFPSGYTGMGNDPANGIDPTGMQTYGAGTPNSYGMSGQGPTSGNAVLDQYMGSGMRLRDFFEVEYMDSDGQGGGGGAVFSSQEGNGSDGGDGEGGDGESTIGIRIWGGLQGVWGTVEMAVGAIGFETGIGILAFVHGADVASAGWTQMLYGQETNSFTAQGAAKVAEVAGANPSTAQWVGGFVDNAFSTVFSGGTNIMAPGKFTYSIKPMRTAGVIDGLTISRGPSYGAKPRFDIHPLYTSSKPARTLTVPIWLRTRSGKTIPLPHYHRGKGSNLNYHRP